MFHKLAVNIFVNNRPGAVRNNPYFGIGDGTLDEYQ